MFFAFLLFCYSSEFKRGGTGIYCGSEYAIYYTGMEHRFFDLAGCSWAVGTTGGSMQQERLIKYLDDLDIVLVETQGTYVLGEEIETLKKATEYSKNHNCNKLLFDHRLAKVVVKTMDGYERPAVYAGIGFDRKSKLASLVNEVDKNLRFYETVCINRGWRMRVFDDYDSAVLWLVGP